MTSQQLLNRLLNVIPLILSLTVHEWAHAYSAFRLGDDTAQMQGRLTLNPIPHIDPIGTLLLPLLGVPFGWAKPVPVNPMRFRRSVTMRAGMMLTASAGPISNFVLAVLCVVVYGLLLRVGQVASGSSLSVLLSRAIELNVALFIFNFLPIPPLDGSRLVDGFLPYSLRNAWEEFGRYSRFLLFAVIIVGGRWLAAPMVWLDAKLYGVCALIAGV